MKKFIIFIQALVQLFCIVWVLMVLFMIPLFIGNNIEVKYAVKMSFVYGVYCASIVTGIGMIIGIIAICSTKKRT